MRTKHYASDLTDGRVTNPIYLMMGIGAHREWDISPAKTTIPLNMSDVEVLELVNCLCK